MGMSAVGLGVSLLLLLPQLAAPVHAFWDPHCDGKQVLG